MKANLKMGFSLDSKNHIIKIARKFDAPLTKVWSVWTDEKLLDKWWAPKPWKAKTKIMNFKAGGYRLYANLGLNGEEVWAREDYKTIIPFKKFEFLDAICDRKGNINNDFPRSDWSISFKETKDFCITNIEIKHKNQSELEKIMDRGFKEGFSSAMKELDAILLTP